MRGEMIRHVSELPIVDAQECEELMAIHRATACPGYRQHLLASSIENLAVSSPFLLPPLINARTRAWHAAESLFGLELETYVEFTALLSWCEGSSLGWHNDSCNDYLSQRHISIIVYLNSQGEGFTGGDLEFDEPTTVIHPKQGHLVAFYSDDRNKHQVSEILSGERFTLTMWLTLLPEYREDDRVIKILSSHPTPILSPVMDIGLLLAMFPELPKEMYYLQGSKDVRLERVLHDSESHRSDEDLRGKSISYHIGRFLGSPRQISEYLTKNLSFLQQISSSSAATGFLSNL